MTKTYRFLDPGTVLHHWCSGMELRPGPIIKDERGPLLGEEFFADPPRLHEPRIDNGYPNLIHDAEAGLYRLYYTEFVVDEVSAQTPLDQRARRQYVPTVGRRVALAYAESSDGLTWTKPDLGIVEFNGSGQNNLVMMDAHGSGVMLDPHDSDPARRYKLLTRIDEPGGGHHLGVAFSADGRHFGPVHPWPEHRPLADTHNYVFWDEPNQRYCLLTRIWVDGLRVQALSTSTDFMTWTRPMPCARGVDAWNQIYSFPAMALDDIWIGFGSLYHDGDRERYGWDMVDLVLMMARDLQHWQFPMAYRPLLPRGEGTYPDGAFDAGCLYAAQPVEIDGQWWLYYFGSNGRHTGFRETALGRARIDPDRLAGYHPTGPAQGTLVCGPFGLTGTTLEVHADVAAGGSLRAEVIDLATRTPLAGSAPITGTGWQQVDIAWPGALPQDRVTIALHCDQAIIHAIRGDLALRVSDLILHEA